MIYLVELLSDSSTNDPSVKSCDIDGDQRCKGFWSSIGLHHVPQERPFPFCVTIICKFSPQIASHFSIILLLFLALLIKEYSQVSVN